MNITEKKFYDNISIIKEMIKNNQPKSEICRLIKVKQSTLNKYLIKYDMWYKGNSSRKGFSHIEQETSYKEYTENGKYINASSLRKKLIKEGYDAFYVKGEDDLFAGEKVRTPDVIAVFSKNQIEII